MIESWPIAGVSPIIGGARKGELVAHQSNRPLYTRKLCFRQQHLNSRCIRIHLFEYNQNKCGEINCRLALRAPRV